MSKEKKLTNQAHTVYDNELSFFDPKNGNDDDKNYPQTILTILTPLCLATV